MSARAGDLIVPRALDQRKDVLGRSRAFSGPAIKARLPRRAEPQGYRLAERIVRHRQDTRVAPPSIADNQKLPSRNNQRK